MKNQVCLKDSKTGSVSFIFNNGKELDQFLNTKPKWMNQKNYSRILERISQNELIKVDYVPSKQFIPDPMPEQHLNNFGAYLAD